MLRPGLDILMQRGRQFPVIVRVHRYDMRGFWIGFQHVSGRVNRAHLRTFREGDVQAVKVPEGFQNVLPMLLVDAKADASKQHYCPIEESEVIRISEINKNGGL